MEAILKKEVITNKQICRLIGIAGFVVLTSLGAFVRVPLLFTPVPLTLQTFFVLLSGAFLGSRLGAVSQLSYVLLGASGLSIFTQTGSGLSYFYGPTAGYLAGFILAAFFIGKFIKYGKDNLIAIFGLFCLADLLLLTCGAIWLRVFLGSSIPAAVSLGMLPFIPGDIIKAFAAAGIYLALKQRIKEVF